MSSKPISSVYKKAFYQGKELPHNIESLSYVYLEGDPDTCDISLRVETEEEMSNPEFQYDSEWVVTWGYAGGDTVTRKIYLQDKKWTLDKNGRSVVLNFADKSIYLKQIKTKELLNKANVMHLALSAANKSGLHVITETNPVLMPNQNDFDNGNVMIAEREGFLAWNPPPDKQTREQFFYVWTQDDVKDWPNINPETGNAEIGLSGIVGPNKKIIKWGGLGDLKLHDDIPAAGKNYKQLLDEYAEYDNLLIDSRDDTLVVKARNFRQAPLKGYHYSVSGEFFDYNNSTKTRNKLGEAANQMFGAWKSDLKTYIQGNSNPDTELRRALIAAYLKKSGFKPNQYFLEVIKKRNRQIQIINKNQKILTEANPLNFSEKEPLPELTNEQVLAEIIVKDNGLFNTDQVVSKTRYGDLTDPVKSEKGVDNYESPSRNIGGVGGMGGFSVPIRLRTKPVFGEDLMTRFEIPGMATDMAHAELAADEAEAKKRAEGIRQENELRMNASIGKFMGDPSHVTGKILYLSGISTGYTGNHYIIKSHHMLDKSGGYITTNDFARQGENLKEKTNKYPTGKSINKKKAKETTEIKFNLSTRKNPR